MELIKDLPEVFEEFAEQRKNSFLALKKIKDQGTPVVGSYCTYFPREIAMAMGAVTVGLCSTSDETIPDAEKDLPKNLCPLIKSSYGFAVTDKCPFFYFSDVVVGETTCDGKKKMYEYMSDFKNVYIMDLPNTQNEAAQKLWKSEIIRFKEYLEEHRDWKTTAVTNTAAAAKKVSADQDKTHAAIASRAAGEIYNLKVLAENICKNDSNVTRFIILAKKPVYENNSSRISVCFEARHASGTLYNVLSHMIYNGLNMTKIESRPIPGKTWEYRFFVDFEGNLRDSAVKNALRGMEAETSYLKILGNY